MLPLSLYSGEEIAKAMTEASRQAKIDAGLSDEDMVKLSDVCIKEELFLDDEDEYDLDDLLDDDEEDDEEEDDDDIFINDGA